MLCPKCNQNKYVIKSGLRHTQKGIIQRFLCKKCNMYFSSTMQPYTQYPLHVILYTLEQYNKGYPVKKAKTLTGKKYRYSPPIQTIYSWIKRYQNTLTFLKLRKQYTLHPENLTKSYYYTKIQPSTNISIHLPSSETQPKR